jgi:hypothetical protein
MEVQATESICPDEFCNWTSIKFILVLFVQFMAAGKIPSAGEVTSCLFK